MTDNPKPCPFCGGEAETDKYAPKMAYCIDGLSGADNDNKKCYNDAILSVEDWNRRPIENAQAEEIEKLQHALSQQTARADFEMANALGAQAEIERLGAALERIITMDIIAHCTWQDTVKAIKAIARAALEREAANE